MNIFGIDFSVAKPAICVYSNNEYHFYIWPKDLKEKNKQLLESAGVHVIGRTHVEIKDLTRSDLVNSNILSHMIINSLTEYIDESTLVSCEGVSFGSRGNMMISLVVWKYILLHKLYKLIPVEHIYSFSPITVKSTANCAKKGSKKFDIINAFIEHGPECKLRNILRENRNDYLKKNSCNYIDGLDDCIDSYFILETLRKKENIHI